MILPKARFAVGNMDVLYAIHILQPHFWKAKPILFPNALVPGYSDIQLIFRKNNYLVTLFFKA